MIVEDHPRRDTQTFVLLTVSQRVRHDVAHRRGGEDREPFDDRAGDEVSKRRVVDSVAAAHGVACAKQIRARARKPAEGSSQGECGSTRQFHRQVRSQTEFGNEDKILSPRFGVMRHAGPELRSRCPPGTATSRRRRFSMFSRTSRKAPFPPPLSGRRANEDRN